jgi:transmembrane sensor
MNSNSPSARTLCRKARAEAAAWTVRLHGPHRSPELEAAFRTWLSASAENARQFERVTEVWDAASGVPGAGLTRLGNWRQVSLTGAWLRAAAVAVVCTVAALAWYQYAFAGVYRTGVGEQRVVRLEDGTRVSMNSATRIEVDFARQRRHVVLTDGEAYFEVAHNPGRPFVVSAGGHDVTAFGTTFLVRYDPTYTAVTLVEGKVTVSNAAAPAAQRGASSGSARRPLALTPGERLMLARNTAPSVDLPRIDALTAWRRGEVVLDRTPLTDAVAEMNRYEDERLIIDSLDVGKLPISGIYHTGDSDGFAQTVARLYRLQVSHKANEIHLTGTAPGTP